MKRRTDGKTFKLGIVGKTKKGTSKVSKETDERSSLLVRGRKVRKALRGDQSFKGLCNPRACFKQEGPAGQREAEGGFLPVKTGLTCMGGQYFLLI